jgi:hypothetical protein
MEWSKIIDGMWPDLVRDWRGSLLRSLLVEKGGFVRGISFFLGDWDDHGRNRDLLGKGFVCE